MTNPMSQDFHVPKNYSRKDLKYIELYNRVSIGKSVLEAELAMQQKTHAAMEAQQELATKSMELTLLSQRDNMRPYRICGAYVVHDEGEGKYRCQLPDYMALADEDDENIGGEVPIVAYGDTPEQATSNFDHLWVHGSY